MSTSIEGPYRILVVEDEPFFRAFLRAMLEKNGYAVAEADTVKKGRALVDEFMPHAVILDGNLPDSPGLTLASQLRQILRYNHIRIVYMTGDPEMAELGDVLRSQYDAFIPKPFKMQLLLDRLERLLPRKEGAGL